MLFILLVHACYISIMLEKFEIVKKCVRYQTQKKVASYGTFWQQHNIYKETNPS